MSESSAQAAVADFAQTFEEDFALVSIASSIGSCREILDHEWLIDSGATKHMTDTLSKFMSVTEIGPGHFVQQGDTVRAVKGIGSVRFRLFFGETLDLHGVLFVPELRTSLISVSALESEGFGVLFKREHVFLIPVGDVDGTILLGSQKESLYTLKGVNVYPCSGWLSGSGTGGETAVAPIIQFPENSSSLVSIGRRLNQYEGFEQEDAEEDADSYEAFKVWSTGHRSRFRSKREFHQMKEEIDIDPVLKDLPR